MSPREDRRPDSRKRGNRAYAAQRSEEIFFFYTFLAAKCEIMSFPLASYVPHESLHGSPADVRLKYSRTSTGVFDFRPLWDDDDAFDNSGGGGGFHEVLLTHQIVTKNFHICFPLCFMCFCPL